MTDSDSTNVLLEMHGITKRFGPTTALEDVSFAINAGEVTALIGENGAGKSTLMRVLSGALAADAGVMKLAGINYNPHHPHDARLVGVSMIYQELTIAPDLSIEDNVMLGCERSHMGILDRQTQRSQIKDALKLLGLEELPLTTLGRELSPAQQQLIEIARALIIDSRVVIFDEPTSSLAAEDVARLFEVIEVLKSQGLAIVYISHFLEEVRELCDHYVVLRDGKSVGKGSLENVTDEEIVRLMIGREVEDLFPNVPHESGEVLVTIQNLSGKEKPRNLSLEIRRGEILGIAGLIGAGRTEFLRTLYGTDPVRGGVVRIENDHFRPAPARSIAAGLGMISEDRKSEGLAQSLSIEENLTMPVLDRYSNFGFLDLKRLSQSSRDWMKTLQVKAYSPVQKIGQLSGGNQQKVAIARVMHQGADLYLMDEPTRGIDVGTKAEIYRLMGQLAAEGKAIVFVSSYLPELMAVCDRIGVMARGKLREVRNREEWTEAEVMQVAIEK